MNAMKRGLHVEFVAALTNQVERGEETALYWPDFRRTPDYRRLPVTAWMGRGAIITIISERT